MQNAECRVQNAERRMQNFGRLDPLMLYAAPHLRWGSRLTRRGAVTAPEFGICNLSFIFLHLHSAPAECIVYPNSEFAQCHRIVQKLLNNALQPL